MFAKDHYDIFISYSHNDEDLILAIAGMLGKEFNLNVFVDAFYWGSTDRLLKEIDDIKCKKLMGHMIIKKETL